MRRVLLRVLGVAILALGMPPHPSQAAGGSSAPSVSPADQAADDYNRGLGHRDKAWQLEERAAAADDPEERGKLEAKALKQYEKAMRAFRSAIEANPRMHQAYSSLGYALRKMGDYQQSLEAYNKALELEPGYTEAIEYRAEAFLGLNRTEEAKQAYLQLFRDDRERADELMAAMKRWVEERTSDPQGLDTSVVEEFAAWLEERSEIAGQTASLAGDPNRTW